MSVIAIHEHFLQKHDKVINLTGDETTHIPNYLSRVTDKINRLTCSLQIENRQLLLKYSLVSSAFFKS